MRSAELSALATRLHSVAIHLLRRVRAEDRATGLSPARLSALSVLVYGGACSLGELAAAEQVKPPSTSRIVAALEAEGLVARRADSSDGRAIIISATDEGRRVLEEARTRRVARLTLLLRGLEAEKLGLIEEATGLLEEALRGSPGGEARGGTNR